MSTPTNNPYSAPRSDLDEDPIEFIPVESPVPKAKPTPMPSDAPGPIPARIGSRVANLMIDAFFLFWIGLELGWWIENNFPPFASQELRFFFSLTITPTYYLVCEGLMGQTLGKLITRTKVVNEHGGPPTLLQVFGRILCRYIPFELFSFFGHPCRGWHDSLPGTYVVSVE